jgi:hypothetical protein
MSVVFRDAWVWRRLSPPPATKDRQEMAGCREHSWVVHAYHVRKLRHRCACAGVSGHVDVDCDGVPEHDEGNEGDEKRVVDVQLFGCLLPFPSSHRMSSRSARRLRTFGNQSQIQRDSSTFST